MQRRQLDDYVGDGGGIGRETPTEAIEIGQSAGIEFSLDGLGEFSLAGAIMGQRQQPDHGAARPLLAVVCQQRLEGALVGWAREELLAVDQVEQRHRFAAQGVDDVAVSTTWPRLPLGCGRPRRSVISSVAPRKHSSRSS